MSTTPPSPTPEKQADFLIAAYNHWGEAFLRNEEMGDRRVNLYITLTTFVLGGLTILAARGGIGETGDFIGSLVVVLAIAFGLVAIYLIGLFTIRRIIERNLATDEFIIDSKAIARKFVSPSDAPDLFPRLNPYSPTKELRYTAPVILTGAPLSLLKRTRFAKDFDPPFNYARDWNKAYGHSQPWMIVEESESHWLADVYDSGWSNLDEMATRHRGKGAINHTDGSATMRAYQHSTDRRDRRRSMDAWKVYYELTDGRIVTAGTWQLSGNRRPKFGYLKSRMLAG